MKRRIIPVLFALVIGSSWLGLYHAPGLTTANGILKGKRLGFFAKNNQSQLRNLQGL